MIGRIWSELRYRVRAAVRRRSIDRELDDELRFHLEREAEKYVRAGLASDAAMRRARLALGGIERTKDEDRDARGVSLIDEVARDVRYAARTFRLAPGFTAAVVLTLALGIGATTGIFSVVDRLLFRPPAFLRDPSTVSRVYLSYDYRGTRTTMGNGFEYRRYLDLAEGTSSFSQVAAFSVGTMAVGTGDDATEMPVGRASASLFAFFDARPALGRFYTHAEDSLPAGERVAVLSYPFWQLRYGGRLDVLGSTIQIGSGTYTIIGVAPDGFAGMSTGAPPVAWVPATAYAALQRARFLVGYNWGWLEMVVRRKPGITMSAAAADLSNAYRASWRAQRAIESLAPVEVARPLAMLGPIQLDRGPGAGPTGRVALWVGGVALVALLVACANVANLLLARAFRRRREIALRLALGVNRGRLVAQLLTESSLLALAGGIAGVFVGRAIAGGFAHLFQLEGVAGGSMADARTLAVCAAITLLVGIVAGLAPALHGAGGDVWTALRSGAREGTYQRSRLRAVLVVLQGALSTALLIAAGLFIRSFSNVRSLPLGYDVDPIIVVDRNMRGMQISSEEQKLLMQRLVEAAAAIPGVDGVTQMVSTPFYNFEGTGLFVPGIDTVSRLGKFGLQLVSPGYFRTVGTRILAGRPIGAEDRAGAPRAIVVSEEMARRLWPGTSALGKCVRVGADTAPCSTVVGISENIVTHDISHAPEANYYIPVDQASRAAYGLYVRVHGRAADHADEVRRALQAVMPGASYVTVLPLSQIVGDAESSWRVGATMFTALGVVALLLAAVGLYSVIAYNVAQRTHEIGVRIAMGARMTNLAGLVLREGLRAGVIGAAIGMLIALAAGRWMAPLLFDESARDPAVFVLVAGVLVTVTGLASAIPAWRAARVDPNVALRVE